jgi:4-hydroxythreonine-4-phosphate dehydrogenase
MMTTPPCLSKKPRKTIAFTLGDAMGIGYEIALKALAHWVIHQQKAEGASSFNLTVFGDIEALRLQAKAFNLAFIEPCQWLQYQTVRVDIGDCTKEQVAGKVAYHSIVKAVEAISQGRCDALLTGPVSKAHWWQAGIHYSGHTELLEVLAQQYWPERGGQPPHQADMLFVYEQFRVLLLTRHIALNQVSQSLEAGSVRRQLRQLLVFLRQQAGIATPKIGILGLNPHAGEVGGDEEAKVLCPVINQLNEEEGALVFSQPLPADAVFRGFNATNPAFDAYVACYHDQGLIPMKLVAGYAATNVTVGLPFVRCSVSHGTAADIAGLGIADASGVFSAMACLLELMGEGL